MVSSGLYLEIWKQKAKKGKIKKSRDWYRYRYRCSVKWFRENGFPMPWLSDGQETEEEPEDDEGKIEEKGDAIEEGKMNLGAFKKLIRDNLQKNYALPDSGRRYCPEVKIFAFVAETFSAHCYDFVREMMDLPSSETIRTNFSAMVAERENRLTHGKVLELIKEYIRGYAVFPDVLMCTLCIDAFTVDPGRPRRKAVSEERGTGPDVEGDDSQNNTFFLVQLTPWNRNYRIYPLQLIAAGNGNASAGIRGELQRIIDQAMIADSRVRIMCVSVDGDEGYGIHFKRSFECISKLVCDGLFDYGRFFVRGVSWIGFVWISDFLHLLKNARTRLFDAIIHVNSCFWTAHGASMARLARFFKDRKSQTFLDGSSLGKMRDSYPLDLFTLKRAFRIADQGGNVDEFLYVLVFGLWMEAVENPNFSLETRMVIIDTLLLFFMTLGKLMKAVTNSPLRQKKQGQGSNVTFATENKIKRFVCTLFAQRAALGSGDVNLGLDRIGSHTEENYIGNIRRICHGDNRTVTVKHQVSRFEIARHVLQCYKIERKITKRANLGGVNLSHANTSGFVYTMGSPSEFARELLWKAGIRREQLLKGADGILSKESLEVLQHSSDEELSVCNFIEMTRDLVTKAPWPGNISRVRESTQGCQIVSRQVAFGFKKKEADLTGAHEAAIEEGEREEAVEAPRRRVRWTPTDTATMKAAIMHKEDNSANLLLLFEGRPFSTLDRKHKAAMDELSAREWSAEEDATILDVVQNGDKGISLKDRLAGRTKKAIDDRVAELTRTHYLGGSGWGDLALSGGIGPRCGGPASFS
jgi:hypothetical protein